MKKITKKILIIAVVIVLALTFVGCDASAFWGYFTGYYPEIPTNYYDDVTIMQGTAQTQTGGLADVIESIRPTVVDVYSNYIFVGFGTGDIEERLVTGMAVIMDKTSDGIYLLCASHCVEDYGNQKINGMIYKFAGVNTRVVIDDKFYSAERLNVDNETASALLFVSKESLGDSYDDVKVTKIPETYPPKEGETILAFSNPYGVNDGTVTKGVLSSSAREITISSGETYVLLQTDAAICYRTDGIIFDDTGHVLGIIFVKAVGTGIENLNFAMPLDQIIDGFHQNGYLLDVEIGVK